MKGKITTGVAALPPVHVRPAPSDDLLLCSSSEQRPPGIFNFNKFHSARKTNARLTLLCGLFDNQQI
ncbi:hypothetical protein UYSO10_2261 [Kosakonia radicincitans]|nr:hypothetical protein UYSO10_2261 [Kosakonia radicincitans]